MRAASWLALALMVAACAGVLVLINHMIRTLEAFVK